MRTESRMSFADGGGSAKTESAATAIEMTNDE
jgi:hypothetical protein